MKLAKQLEDRRKSRVSYQDQISFATKGFEEQIETLKKEIDELLEEV